ncbi:hypothetical protein [Alteromonas sp. RKMC-009]|nr:hypothetical protein [Alteromonas sp. RKMC-009]
MCEFEEINLFDEELALFIHELEQDLDKESIVSHFECGDFNFA